ncbi:hypothetical protein E2R51_17365 [Jeotgalibacillus sp. S-D1]|uniref:hypothetical protein n=1 Tax=Jeotgalibacillus sp. S-D1 TaxID=2552189 RepID=UPI00105A92AC|nr:hypothetical protein [Jeotgalibacillus sp. S-D1]TDL30753.1 hypothetical protein E2R51_17365 [Jeotgalibacillus sp. S-D1]
MENHTEHSWKEDQLIAQLHNSVDNAFDAVGQAHTNPTEEKRQDAREKIQHAERSFKNAVEARGEIEPIIRLKEQLFKSKESYQKLH